MCSRILDIHSHGDVKECTKPQNENIQRRISNTGKYKIAHPSVLVIYVTAQI
jgi:hypothetical protein